MPRIQLEPPGPTESCRVDYLTTTFKLRDTDDCVSLVDFANDIGHHVAPAGYMSEPRPGRHAAEVRDHCSGVQVELTHPDSPKRNAGLGILSIPGQIFAALAVQERANLFRDVYLWRGFFRCTRIDMQVTAFNLPLTIEEFCDEVAAGNIWPKHFSSGMPYGDKGRDGQWRKPPTQYFGASESPTRARIYRHGAKHGWEIPDIRFEVQQRKRNASDTFRSLVKTISAEDNQSPLLLTGEANVTKNVLMEKLDLRDTSAISREKLGSKWLRKAPPVEWYFDLVTAPEAPVERSAVPVRSLVESEAACAAQYGGKVFARALQTMAVEGADLGAAGGMVLLRFAQHCKEEHRAQAKEGLSPEAQARVDELYAQLTKEAAWVSEVFVNG